MDKVIIILLLLLTVCSTGGDVDFELELGEVHEIQLRENRSTGYIWFYQIEDNQIIEIVEDYFEAPESNPLKAGASGTRHIQFEGVSAGETSIRLFLARDENDEDIKEEVVYIIKVSKS